MDPAASMPRRRAFRVGVTGHRNVSKSAYPQIEADVTVVLQTLVETISELAAPNGGVAGSPESSAFPVLRFSSSLARGADRIAARAALTTGFTLHAVLPFAREEYERDFAADPNDLAEFRELLGRVVRNADDTPEIMEIDGGRGIDEARSYRVAGRVVVARSDLMIAVWNGTAGEGHGGTWDTMQFALRQGVPLIIIDAEGRKPPRWATSLAEVRRTDDPADAITLPLKAYVNTLITSPKPWKRHLHGLFDRLTFWGAPKELSPEQVLSSEHPLPDRWIWSRHAAFLRWASQAPAPGNAAKEEDAESAADPVFAFWRDRMRLPDLLATDYAKRYRSTYVWIFALAAFSVAFGSTALTAAALQTGAPQDAHSTFGHLFHEIAAVTAAIELALLVSILALVRSVKRGEWHEKSIEYRLLAELYRKQSILAPLGGTLPISTVRSAVGGHRAADRATWVAWLFEADQRAAPFPRGPIVFARHRHEIAQLIDGQLAYHHDRARQSEAAAHRLEAFGLGFFALIIAAVLGKFAFGHALHLPWVALAFGWLAIILPGFSAAFVGIRAYAELELLAAQSNYMTVILERSRKAVEAIDPEAPLASSDLGLEAAELAGAMLQDLEGWARLFRLKVAELG